MSFRYIRVRSNEDYVHLMKELEAHGYRWRFNRQLPTSRVLYWFNDSSNVIEIDPVFNLIGHDYVEYHEMEGMGDGIEEFVFTEFCTYRDEEEEEEEVRAPASDHYKGKVEPIELIDAMGFGVGFEAGNVIKYVSRFDKKGTPLKDLEKARYYLDRLIERAKEDGED